MISYINEELFEQNSISKQFIITDNNSINLTNEDIHIDGIELSESINSEDDLKFGSCITSTLRFTTSNTADLFKDKYLTFSIILDEDTENPFVVGTYKVVEETLTADRSKKEITAKDFIYEINNADVVSWYDSLSFPMTLAQFRASFFSYMGIEEKTATLVNDSMTIERSIAPSILSGAEVIRAICEINGVFGHITRDNKFEYLTLNTTSVYDVTASLGVSCEYENYDSSQIDRLIIRQEDNDIGVQYGSGDNTLVVQGNFLVYGIGTVPLQTIAQNLYSVVSVPTYKPCKLECIGNPCVEVGDMITITTKNGTTFDTYVLNRTLTGGQSLRDSITADGNEIRGNEINSPQSQWLQLLGKSNVFERTLEQTTSQIADLNTAVTTVTQTASDLEIQVQSLQEQIDGEAGYYERDGEPTLLNYPYWDFTTAIPCNNTIQLSETYTEDMQAGGNQFPHFYYSEQDRKDNMRALCIDLETGNGYRFVIENNVWLWKQIADSDFSVLFNQIVELRATVEGIETSVSDVEIEVDNHEARISTNESDISQQSTKITAKVDKRYQNQGNTFGWTLDTSGFDVWNSGGSVFKVNSSGAEIKGKITANSGYIGNGQSGFTIGNTSIYNGMTSLSDTTNNGIYVGTDGIALGKGAFKVDSNGKATLTSARFGYFELNSGNIAYYSQAVGNTLVGEIYGESGGEWGHSGILGAYSTGKLELRGGMYGVSISVDDPMYSLGNISLTSSNNGTIYFNNKEYSKCLSQTLTLGNANYAILFSEGTNNTTTQTEGARKGRLLWNPYTCTLFFTNDSTGGRIEQPSSQALYIRASQETNYGVNVGVMDSMWTLSPIVDGAMNLGTPSHRWGQIYSTNSVISTSDKKEKKNIKALGNLAKDFIMELRPVSFKFKNRERTHYGLIAQDVEETMNDLGISDLDFGGFCKDVVDDKEIYGLRYEEFIAPLIRTVQLQQKEIEELKRRVG